MGNQAVEQVARRLAGWLDCFLIKTNGVMVFLFRHLKVLHFEVKLCKRYAGMWLSVTILPCTSICKWYGRSLHEELHVKIVTQSHIQVGLQESILLPPMACHAPCLHMNIDCHQETVSGAKLMGIGKQPFGGCCRPCCP